MSINLTNDTILITGGASGIGLEMAKQLLANGNTVIITGRSLDKLEAVKKEFPAINYYQGDVSDAASVHALYEKVSKDFPHLNVLINNAGIMKAINFNDASTEGICDEINTNLNGPIYMTQEFLPLLKKQKESAVVNVSSGLAFITFDRAPIYSASKIGIHAYTKTLRLHLKDTSVKVFELAPPKTNKPLFGRTTAQGEKQNKMPEMPVPEVVEAMIKGIRKDKFEILPGMSKMLKLAGRFQL